MVGWGGEEKDRRTAKESGVKVERGGEKKRETEGERVGGGERKRKTEGQRRRVE